MSGMPHDATTSIRRLERLLEASRLLNSTLEIRELADIVLRIIRDELTVDRCTLFVVDRKEKLLRSFLAHGAEAFEIKLPVGEGLAGAVALSGEPLEVLDAYADPRFRKDVDQALNYRTNDVLCLPIHNCERNLIGVLQLLNRQGPITDEDKEFLTSISTYLGIALHNAWLHRELEASRNAERELRAVADRLAQADKAAALNEMIAGVIHEVKNPLTVAVGNCFLVREETGVPTSVRARVETIKLAIDKSLKVAANFLDFARGTGGERAPADINRLIRQTAELLDYEFRQKSVGLVLDLEKVPVLIVDAGSIQQVLVNLFKNAEYAASARNQTPVVTVASWFDAEKRVIRVEVMDNGAGIPESARSKVFEPFFTTKPAGVGNGLGLAVSRRIIEAHQGTLTFDSNPDDGTTFMIELPVAEAPAGSRNESAKVYPFRHSAGAGK
jgi:signal transduction histidine kinase